MDVKQYVLDNKPLLLRKVLETDPQLCLQKDDDRRTPLFWAVSQNQPELVSIILAAAKTQPSFNINDTDESGWSVLHVAASVGSVEVVEQLLSFGPDINAQSLGGQTPLFLAVSRGNTSVVELLIEKQADVKTKDRQGQTCLHRAAAQGRQNITKLLLKSNAKINASDNDGWTPLHHAYAEERADVVLDLLRAGADDSIKNIDGDLAKDVCPNPSVVGHVVNSLQA